MAQSKLTVLGLSSTPVKGLRLRSRPELMLQPGGIAGDRLFYLVDGRGWMVNGKHCGELQRVSAELDEAAQQLSLTFPGGHTVAGAVELGTQLTTRFYSQERPARVLLGPFARALSAHAGIDLRVVAPAEGSTAIDRGAQGAVSLVSMASLERLADVAGESEVDPRRFRMSILIGGAQAHEEDHWVGRRLSVGGARIAVLGHVGRCIVTSRDPDSGEVDLPTLDHLRAYRAAVASTEPLPFGVHGAVLEPGLVRLGDELLLEVGARG